VEILPTKFPLRKRDTGVVILVAAPSRFVCIEVNNLFLKGKYYGEKTLGREIYRKNR
jgi:hypothetical protein